MISLRQHAISIAAIFVALAVGVFLGSGVLSTGLVSGLRDDKSQLERDLEQANQRANALELQLNSADGFAAGVSARTLRDTLPGNTVLVVTTPDSDPGDVEALDRVIGQAGGAVTGRLALTESFVDATGGDRLRTVVNNVIPAGVTLQTGAVDQGSLAGDLLGAILQANPESGQPQGTPEERALALDTLRGGGFLTYEGAVEPAQLAVVLTGEPDPEQSSDGATGNRGAVVARFAAGLDARGSGVVLAGRPGSAHGNGAVAVARSDSALSSRVSTVDDVDRESGRITVPLALQEQLGGGAGRYGTGPGAAAVTVGVPAG
ncbi:copper transporter [Rhodococcus triatomae]|uniref:Copper transport outer membrane protein, MctB n=1 Tax=Rhodococcus triatomae TaxID=300028 RepID=A0A1G8SUD9_9NOCA|nr:copper transporter [Rhodococcus triatomae]QNG18680.1 copper transporter [Rhodococcus triatomae]QNG25408.1 copper transporter [Rhodococcus triatomae]SDJ32846.1 Copper transport outer membrane protein, MctB [Rhodococcus triatomae]